MAMTLSGDSLALLKRWLGQETWHTSHATDENLFFQFVGQYVSDHGYSLNEEALRKTIADIAGIADRQALHEIAQERVALMRDILDFMKATGRR
jgi:hypothetical protein